MQLTERQQSQAAEVERGVADAIKGRDFEVAANLAAGHPDVRRHGELMKDIFNAKHPNGAVSAIEVTRTDLAGTPILPRSKMFEIHQREAQIVDFNPRAEKAGDGTRPAGDLKVMVNLDQGALDYLEPSLREWLFAKLPGQGDLAAQGHPAPNLRQPKIEQSFAWTPRYAGYTLVVHELGIDANRDLVIQACQFNEIKLEPQEGGTVICTFRLQFHPSEGQAGKLSTLIQSKQTISLHAPEGAEEERKPAAKK